MSWHRDTVNKIQTFGELFAFIWRQKIWWMFPLAFVIVTLGIIIVVGATSGAGPFTYVLF